VAALAAIIVLGRWLSDRGTLVRSWRGIRDYVILLSIPVVLILGEKDLGSTVVIAGVGGILLFLAGARYRHLFTLLAIGGVSLAHRHRRALPTQPDHLLWPVGDRRLAEHLLAGTRPSRAGSGRSDRGRAGQLHPEVRLAARGPHRLHLRDHRRGAGPDRDGGGGGRLHLPGLAGDPGVAARPDRFGTLVSGGITAWICIQAFVNVAAVTP